MTFAIPVLLWLAIPVVALSVLGVRVGERRRRRAIQAFGDASLIAPLSALPSDRRRVLVAACGVAGIALSLLALARPRVGTGERTVAGSGAERPVPAGSVAVDALDQCPAVALGCSEGSRSSNRGGVAE